MKLLLFVIPNQFGFKKGLSIQNAIIQLYKYIATNSLQNKSTARALFDIKRYFEKIFLTNSSK